MTEDKSIRDVVRTREVLIYDDTDKIRMALDAFKVEPKITIYKSDGTPAIEISSMESDSDSRRITLFGKAHKWRFRMTCNENGAGLIVFDRDGKCIKSWGLFEEGMKKKSKMLVNRPTKRAEKNKVDTSKC